MQNAKKTFTQLLFSVSHIVNICGWLRKSAKDNRTTKAGGTTTAGYSKASRRAKASGTTCTASIACQTGGFGHYFRTDGS
jgi:hypothetical protein